MKECSECKEEKPLKDMAAGRNVCSLCLKAYTKAFKEKYLKTESGRSKLKKDQKKYRESKKGKATIARGISRNKKKRKYGLEYAQTHKKEKKLYDAKRYRENNSH